MPVYIHIQLYPYICSTVLPPSPYIYDMCTFMYILYVYTHADACTNNQAINQSIIHIHIHIHIHTYTHTHIHTYTHTHIHTYTHTHTTHTTQIMVFSTLRPLTQKAATQPQVLPKAQLRKGAEVTLKGVSGRTQWRGGQGLNPE